MPIADPARQGRLPLVATSLLALLSVGVLMALIPLLNVQPVSDFLFYHEVAQQFARGGGVGPVMVYYHAPGYPLLLSLIYRIHGSPSPLWAQALNALALVLTSTLLAACAPARCRNLRLAALVAAVFVPAGTVMVFTLGNEIVYTFLFVCGLGTLRFFVGRRLRPSLGATGLLAAGLLFGLSQAVRPVTLPLLAVATIALAFDPALGRTGRERLRTIVCGVLSWGPLLIGFFTASITVYMSAGYGPTWQPRQNGLFTLFVGLNTTAAGHWNAADAEHVHGLLEAHGFRYEEVNALLRREAQERFGAGLLGNAITWPKRLGGLLNPTANLEWVRGSLPQVGPLGTGLLRVAVTTVSAGVLLLAGVGAATLACSRPPSLDSRFGTVLVVTLVTFTLGQALLLEVNGRYGTPLWILMAFFVPAGSDSMWRLARQTD